MTEKDFLQVICEDADDDVPRLIFSDWLDEHGHPERAEFIRLQLARAADDTGDAARPELMERERELFLRHKDEWLRELPELPGIVWGDSFPQAHVDLHHFRRGFPFQARLTKFDSFDRHAAAIRQHTTIRHLCYMTDNRQTWMEELQSFLKSPYLAAFSHLTIWPSVTAARLGGIGLRMLTASPNVSGLRYLDLGHHALGDQGVAVLADSPRFVKLAHLGLAANDMTSQGLAALTASSHLKQVRHLDLSLTNPWEEDHFNRFDAAGLAVLAAAPTFRDLQTLRLSSTGLNDEAVTALAKGTWPRLRSLDMESNKISAIGVRALARSQILSGLRELRLANNPVGTAGAVALIKTAPLGHLHTLDLGECRLGTEAVYVLGGSEVGQRLGHLDFSGNPIGIDGLKFFLERRFWPNLRHVRLSYMPHERDAAESVKECWGERVDLAFRSHDYLQ